MAVMAVLVIVGAGVIARQFQVNPAVVALRPESHGQAPAPASEAPALIDLAGSGIAPFSPPERFGPQTLYEKINGRADLYLSAGFVSLATQRFAGTGAAGAWVELFVYDMATPANAFSVYSMQRREGARSDDSAPAAYRTENALFLTHGSFYLEIIGTDSSEELQQTMGALARRFVEAHGGAPAAQAPGEGLLPAAGFQPGSLQLITANAFGYEQLDQIYSGEYLVDGARLTAFVSERAGSAEAAALAEAYRQALASYGATAVEGSVPMAGAAVMQVFDTYEIVFSRGRYLAGIHEAGSLEAALALAGRLAAHLEGLGGLIK